MSASADRIRNILITGSPGVGKTTIIRKLCSSLQKANVNISGIYTEEVRQCGQRIGFDIVDVVTGKRAQLSSSIMGTWSNNAPRVGKYYVNLGQFEPLALESLKLAKDDLDRKQLIIIDEIGKMEPFSEAFSKEAENLFDAKLYPNLSILATIPVEKPSQRHNLPIVDRMKNAEGNQVIVVTKENRDKLDEELKTLVLQLVG